MVSMGEQTGSRMKTWRTYLALGTLMVLVYFLPFFPIPQVLYNVIGLSAVAAVAVGARLRGAARPLSWYLLAGGLFAFVAGDLVWTFHTTVLRVELPYPSVADVFYLAAYPLFAAGLALMVHARAPWRDDAGLIDATIIATGAGVLSWIFFVSPQTDGLSLLEPGPAVTAAYPLTDVLLLAVAARLVLGGGARTTAYYLLVGGFIILLASDVAYTALILSGGYQSGDPIDAGWMVSYLLIGAAALHPSMPSLTALTSPGRVRISRYRLGLLISASLTAPAALLIQDLRGEEIDVLVIFAGSVILFVLVSSRMATLAAELHRNRGEARFRSLVQNASDAIMILDAEGNALYASPSVERFTGHSPKDLLGEDIFEMIHPEDEIRARRFLTECISDSATDQKAQFRCRRADGSWRHLEATAANLMDDPNVGGVLLTARDVTKRVALEEQLRHRAVHDPLTGLPNRALFMDRLKHALERSARYSLSTAVLFLDLDDFKVVNDSLGHEAGDELLVCLAGRFGSCLRSVDTVARLGGDEFAVLLEDVSGVDEATAAAGRILAEIGEPVDLRKQKVFTTASVGITMSAAEISSPEEMLKDADIAMYEAKSRGKGHYEVFGSGMKDRILKRLQLESEMHRALREGEFRLYYQPSVSLEDETVTGFEALVRWNHPTRGILSPAEFIPVAEESGLILQIGSWVLREACRQTREWQRMRPADSPLTISVNLSARQFRQPGLALEVAEVLIETDLSPADLVLEITETVAMDDSRTSRETLQKLKDLGTKLAIDDFGTGYASLSYLQNFPVEVLKIDRSFVNKMADDPKSASIVTTVISFANSLGLGVVAEGIETEEQLARLKELGCPVGQGYHFSKPLPKNEAQRFAVPGLVK